MHTKPRPTGIFAVRASEEFDVDEMLEQEFRACLRRAGLRVPEDRMDAMRAAFLQYRSLAEVLDEPLPYGAEPAAAWIPDYATPTGMAFETSGRHQHDGDAANDAGPKR